MDRIGEDRTGENRMGEGGSVREGGRGGTIGHP